MDCRPIAYFYQLAQAVYFILTLSARNVLTYEGLGLEAKPHGQAPIGWRYQRIALISSPNGTLKRSVISRRTMELIPFIVVTNEHFPSLVEFFVKKS